ncbi:MAG: metal ABC transporter permease [Armatimonadetes bacterium]|nr:metal ABC transporter permease [Armatimonadota bacterium]
MSPIHCIFGLHIVRRGVIFIDLAVAQMAALGMAIGLARGYDIQSTQTYYLALGFAMGTALLIALTRFRLGRVPHEAIIGIIFVMASALGIIVLENTEHGVEELKEILSGSILLVQPSDVSHTAIIYSCILAVALLMWQPTAAVSLNEPDGPTGTKRILVDFVFYALLAFVVASSVKIAGVLVVFSWLVMPPVCAFLWLTKMKHAVALALPLALIGSMAGLWLSYKKDWPTGPAIVVVLGALVTLFYVVKLLTPVGKTDPVAPA